MIDQSLHQVFLEAMGRIQRLKATSVDLALVLVMSELIEEVGGSVEMAKRVSNLEAKWRQGLREYARGEV